MAGGTLETGGTGTVINVLTAVLASPAIDTHAVVATVGVVARSTILAGVGHELTLVHIFCAVLTCEGPQDQQPQLQDELPALSCGAESHSLQEVFLDDLCSQHINPFSSPKCCHLMAD